MVMAASGFRAPTCLCSSSPSSTAMKATVSSSLSVAFQSKGARLGLYSLCPKGLCHFSPWSGLKHLGISVTWRSSKMERRKGRDRVAYASLFGVGAPEALVIGVVALLVFGPKGLAEVARSLGKTLRAFQPTIRELQEVSRDFKSTLEKEIGLDDISTTTPRSENFNASSSYTSSSYPTTLESKSEADSNGTSSAINAYTSEEYLKITEEQLQAAAASQQEQMSSQSESQLEAPENPQDGVSSPNGDSAIKEDSDSVGKPSIASPEEQEQQGKVSSPEAIVKETDV